MQPSVNAKAVPDRAFHLFFFTKKLAKPGKWSVVDLLESASMTLARSLLFVYRSILTVFTV
jgi:hypothetical protein